MKTESPCYNHVLIIGTFTDYFQISVTTIITTTPRTTKPPLTLNIDSETVERFVLNTESRETGCFTLISKLTDLGLVQNYTVFSLDPGLVQNYTVFSSDPGLVQNYTVFSTGLGFVQNYTVFSTGLGLVQNYNVFSTGLGFVQNYTVFSTGLGFVQNYTIFSTGVVSSRIISCPNGHESSGIPPHVQT